jgi:hypothetical protein
MSEAGMPYARSVQQAHPIPRDTLPDAGLVFDTLLRRQKVGLCLPLAMIHTATHWRTFFSLSDTPPDCPV